MILASKMITGNGLGTRAEPKCYTSLIILHYFGDTEIAGISIWEMLEAIASKKIPIQYYPEDLKEDIRTLKKVLE